MKILKSVNLWFVPIGLVKNLTSWQVRVKNQNQGHLLYNFQKSSRLQKKYLGQKFTGGISFHFWIYATYLFQTDSTIQITIVCNMVLNKQEITHAILILNSVYVYLCGRILYSCILLLYTSVSSKYYKKWKKNICKSWCKLHIKS